MLSALPATVALLAAFSGAADQHWTERSVPDTCEVVTHRTLDLPPRQVARAWMLGDTGEPFRLPDGSCLIEYDAAKLALYSRWIYGPHRTRSEHRWAAFELCADEVHEEGHLRGKVHSETGVMAPDAGTVPWRCKVVVRELIR